MLISSIARDYTRFTRKELIDRILELESLHLPEPDLLHSYRLTFNLRPQEARIFGTILTYAGKVCRHDFLEEVVYPDAAMRDRLRAHKRDGLRNTVQAHVCHIRRKLKPFGITINTVWFHGFSIDRANADRVALAVKGKQGT